MFVSYIILFIKYYTVVYRDIFTVKLHFVDSTDSFTPFSRVCLRENKRIMFL